MRGSFPWVSLLLVACTPAHLVALPDAEPAVRAEVLVFREKGALLLAGVPAILGVGGQDRARLRAGQRVTLTLAAGAYGFRVRSDQADQPQQLDVVLMPGQTQCLRVVPNAAHAARSLTAFAPWPVELAANASWYVDHAFLIEPVDCPAPEALGRYREIAPGR